MKKDSVQLTTKTLSKKSPFVLVLLGLLPIVFLVVIVLILNSSVPTETKPPKTGASNQQVNTVKILLEQPVSGIYPNIKNQSRDLYFSNNFFEGLTSFVNGQIQNNLAENWTAVDSNTWNFSLKKDRKFSDGTALTSQDVKFSLEEAVKNNWPINNPLSDISSVDAPDNYTVVIHTAKPIPALVTLLTSVQILSKKQYTAKSATDFAVGSGPYKLVSFTTNTDKTTNHISDQTIIMEVNPYYLGPKPHALQVVYDYLDTGKKSKLSNTDLMANYQIIDTTNSDQKITDALASENYFKFPLPTNAVNVLFLNEKNITSPVKDQRVREAMYFSIDPKHILDDSRSSGLYSSEIVSPLIFGFNPDINRPKVDNKKASALMVAANLQPGFTLTLNYPKGQDGQASILAKQLKTIGITAILTPADNTANSKKLVSGDYEALISSWTPDYFDASTILTDALASEGTKNYAGITNTEIDKKATELSSTQDPSKRQKILQDALLLETTDLGWIPLWGDQYNIYVKNTLDFRPSVPFILGNDLSAK